MNNLLLVTTQYDLNSKNVKVSTYNINKKQDDTFLVRSVSTLFTKHSEMCVLDEARKKMCDYEFARRDGFLTFIERVLRDDSKNHCVRTVIISSSNDEKQYRDEINPVFEKDDISFELNRGDVFRVKSDIEEFFYESRIIRAPTGKKSFLKKMLCMGARTNQ